MIEINLLPGARKPVKSGGAGGGIGAALSGVTAQIKDGFLIFGVIGLVLGAAAVGYMWWSDGRTETALNERLRRAEQDSIVNAGVLRELRAARLQQDAVNRQLGIIRTIDGGRFTWPHMLDEVSEALPAYTWLTTVSQTSPVMPVPVLDSLSRQAARDGTDLVQVVTADSVYQLGLRVVGRTIDFQALTSFMRELESSPFVEGVTLAGSSLVPVEGYQVTEFTLTMRAQAPDSTAVRRVPLSIAR